MTFVHFINCVALAYAPYVVTYKTSILSEYNTMMNVGFAGLIYVFTQLVKMLTLATFFPSLEQSTAVLIAGVGWAGAQVLFSYFLSFWVGARGLEFDWKYIQMALDSNITLIHVLATASLVWVWTRKDLNRSLLPVVTSLLVLSVFRTVAVEFFVNVYSLHGWSFLMLKTVVTLAIAAVSMQLYAGFIEST
uniref:BOS complex subunit TMEM147 n=1 Tax=Ciona savignyi TaxID=51511 RepID=H2Z024_CIOSA